MEATRCQPNARAITVMSSSGTIECDDANHQRSSAETTSAARLSQCRPGSINGEDLIRALSLRNATIEPVSVTAPMKTPRNTSTLCTVSESAPTVRKELMPTSTAARPTKLCSIATSSGICVISTTRARHRPMAAPTAIATAMKTNVVSACWDRSSTPHTVAMRASAIPVTPKALPSLAVSCLERPARDSTKSTAATM